jgi:hypothetical protein
MVVRKAARMAEQLNIPIVGVVENMSYARCPNCGERIDIFGPSKSDEVAEQVDAPFLGRLPLDPALAERCDAGEIEAYPGEDFEPIAERIEERVPEEARQLVVVQQQRSASPRVR